MVLLHERHHQLYRWDQRQKCVPLDDPKGTRLRARVGYKVAAYLLSSHIHEWNTWALFYLVNRLAEMGRPILK